MKKLLAILKDNRGDGHIDSIFYMLIMGLTLAFGMSVWTASAGKDNSHDLAELAARQISANGAVDGSTIKALLGVAQNSRYAMQVNAPDAGVSVQIPISNSETSLGSTAIQYGTPFTVTVYQVKDDKIGVDAQQSQTVSEGVTVPGVSECWTK